MKKNRLYIFVAILLLVASTVAWASSFNWDFHGLIYFIPMLILPFNLFLCILLYGKTGRINLQNIETTSTIDTINKGYQDNLVDVESLYVEEESLV